ncbi:MAG TPA: homoserine dehydrogenase [Blastocatellia bacterium]|nr:homoserine dehydrogenase [Blastocatellia bacterium]
MELQLAFIGFGNVARAFARILNDRKSRLDREFGLQWKTTAIATASHGCITSNDGIDLLKAATCVQRDGNLAELYRTIPSPDPKAVVEKCNADVLFETTRLNIADGEPATSYIRTALLRGINVITANKGPVAFGYSELKALAARRGASFRFEGVVMDGTPVFNLVERCLPGTRVVGFAGVLNSTTNLILTEMESGRSVEESLADAQRLGIAEANADHDIDGWDAAVKAVALANVLMDADARPGDVVREGIREVTPDRLAAARAAGMAIRLVARGKRQGDDVKLSVSPEVVPLSSTLGGVRGTSNALMIETDLMGELAIIETDPGVDQTAYALLSDMIAVHEDLDKAAGRS